MRHKNNESVIRVMSYEHCASITATDHGSQIILPLAANVPPYAGVSIRGKSVTRLRRWRRNSPDPSRHARAPMLAVSGTAELASIKTNDNFFFTIIGEVMALRLDEGRSRRGFDSRA